MDTGEHAPEESARQVADEVSEATREYGSQMDYLARVSAAADARTEQVAAALRSAFAIFLRREEVEIIDFQALTVMTLAEAIQRHPVILKSLLATCNVAGRALERDLDLKNIDTYGAKFTSAQAHAIAGYIKGFLPPALPLAALTQIDRIGFIDKEIRASKGRWEKLVNTALNRFSGMPFRKAKFTSGGQAFELDSAYQEDGEVRYGVDIKRIEARRDIHKRADEIVNKAAKLKLAFPQAKFGAVVYYPFITEHGNIRDRLESEYIDSIQFAGESNASVNQAARLLLAKFGIEQQGEQR